MWGILQEVWCVYGHPSLSGRHCIYKHMAYLTANGGGVCVMPGDLQSIVVPTVCVSHRHTPLPVRYVTCAQSVTYSRLRAPTNRSLDRRESTAPAPVA